MSEGWVLGGIFLLVCFVIYQCVTKGGVGIK